VDTTSYEPTEEYEEEGCEDYPFNDYACICVPKGIAAFIAFPRSGEIFDTVVSLC
jgi:hypothetical protein